MLSKLPNQVDVAIGHRIRVHRMAKGVSQEQLGKTIGVTFQQIQKYENGTNRICSSRLQKLADGLGLPVITFFESMDKSTLAPFELMQCYGAVRLLRIFNALRKEQQKALLQLAETMDAKPKVGRPPNCNGEHVIAKVKTTTSRKRVS